MARLLYPSLEQIEDAVVAALQADTTIQAYARAVQSFQGELLEALEEQSFRDPAFLVVISGGDIEASGHLQHQVELEVGVVVRATNLRGNKYQRAPSSSAEVGTYQMVQDVLRVLSLSDLALSGLDELEPKGWELLKTGSTRSRSVSAQLVTFTTHAELREEIPGDSLEEVAATYETHDSDGAWSDVAMETIDVDS